MDVASESVQRSHRAIPFKSGPGRDVQGVFIAKSIPALHHGPVTVRSVIHGQKVSHFHGEK
jgi:hypothetical protein